MPFMHFGRVAVEFVTESFGALVDVQLIQNAIDLGEQGAVELPLPGMFLDVLQQEVGHHVPGSPAGHQCCGQPRLGFFGIGGHRGGDQRGEALDGLGHLGEELSE